VRTEFAFDINQLARNRMPPASYLEHVGLEVPRSLLERTFFETYGLTLRSQLGNIRPAVKSYRSSVRHFIPRFAYAEVVIHKSSFPPDSATPEFLKYQDRIAQAGSANGWERYRRRKPGFSTYMLAFVIRIIPKIGPISDLAIRGPNAQTQEKYVASVNNALDVYDGLLNELKKHPGKSLTLANRDLDTGQKVQPGGYRLTDKTYAKLLREITANPDHQIPAGLKRDILAFYADPNAPITTRKHARAWKQVLANLATLKQMQAIS
ncbi:MAG TPA: hypothetical protein VMU62_05285, partial [Acidobacteriaceae bacterium]|nr:hypothetical protein [Acidobacteriaceae bacterium]